MKRSRTAIGFRGGRSGLRHAAWGSLCACLLLAAPAAIAAEPLAQLEEEAMKAAVARVAPSVVRIETVGGLERVGNVLIGTGSTTGLVASEDGYIVSSAFNFVQKPDSILVTLPDGNRMAARLVATDFDRKLVLLKVNVTAPLAVPGAVAEREIRVGQWAIAVGRTFEADRPSISVGIVSAVSRIWNKAIQTDAKVSPSNYGGPLVDIQGRVLGVLVPLAPDTASEVAGVDWYDSGIGFAVPLEHVFKILPRLKEGHDLHTGIMGISLKSPDIFSQPAEIAACRINSPAYKAGIQTGDQIVEADGQSITRQAQLKMVLGRHYAGDHVPIVLLRGKERIGTDVELTDKLEPYEFPFLGFLPMRPLKGQSERLVVRYVFPQGPAAALAAGDVVLSLAGTPVKNAAKAREQLRNLGPDQSLEVEIERDGKLQKIDVKLGRLPEALPGDLPPAHAAALPSAVKAEPSKPEPAEPGPAKPEGAKPGPAKPDAEKPDAVDLDAETPTGDAKPQIGKVSLKLPEFENACLAYVPESYHADMAYGLVVWLHPPGGYHEEELLDLWKPLCQAHDLILLAPKSSDPARWQPSETKFIRRMIDEILTNYRIDRTRIVVHGQEGGGGMAYVVAFANRDLLRAVAAIDAPLPPLSQPPENDPIHRLAFYTTRASKVGSTLQLDSAVKRLRDLKFPVTVKEVGPQGRYLTPPELAELARWIDTLDRL